MARSSHRSTPETAAAGLAVRDDESEATVDPRTRKAKLEGAWAPLIGRRGEDQRNPRAAADHLRPPYSATLALELGLRGGARRIS